MRWRSRASAVAGGCWWGRPSIRRCWRRRRVPAVIPVRPDGTVDLAALAALLAEAGPALVCLMAANNETGVLHPLAEAAALCRAQGALLHVDAVQAAGRVALPAACDSLALSGHKLGGPPGPGRCCCGRGSSCRR